MRNVGISFFATLLVAPFSIAVLALAPGAAAAGAEDHPSLNASLRGALEARQEVLMNEFYLSVSRAMEMRWTEAARSGIPKAEVMELDDCASPLLAAGVATSELEEANGAIFGPQEKATNQHAARGVKALGVRNQDDTNC